MPDALFRGCVHWRRDHPILVIVHCQHFSTQTYKCRNLCITQMQMQMQNHSLSFAALTPTVFRKKDAFRRGERGEVRLGAEVSRLDVLGGRGHGRWTPWRRFSRQNKRYLTTTRDTELRTHNVYCIQSLEVDCFALQPFTN